MGESFGKSRQPIDIEEFERRLRAPANPVYADSDPLAELTRLVEMHDARREQPAERIALPPPSLPETDAPGDVVAPADWLHDEAPMEVSHDGSTHDPLNFEPLPGAREWDRDARDWDQELRALAGGQEQPRLPRASEQDADFSSLEHREPPVRAAMAADPMHDTASAHEIEDFHQLEAPAPRDLDAEAGAWPEVGPESHREPPPVAPMPAKASRKGLWIAGGGVALAMAVVAGGFAMKGVNGGSKEPPTILANAGPAKIQPDTATTANNDSTRATVLDKGGERLGPSRVVNNQEQPLDINAQARVTPPAGVTAPSAPLNGLGNLIEPRRVKTVSVRPDGSIIDSDAAQPPRAPVPPTPAAPTPTPRPPAAATPAATPAAAKPATSKTTARVATTPHVEPTAPQTDAGGSATPAAKPPRPAPAPPKVAAAKPPTTSDASPSARSGGFAVQFAAAGSEEEARAKVARIRSQFADSLGGRGPAIVRGEANGKPVFRVRAGGMTREEAAALCSKVKSSGGDCFVAGN